MVLLSSVTFRGMLVILAFLMAVYYLAPEFKDRFHDDMVVVFTTAENAATIPPAEEVRRDPYAELEDVQIEVVVFAGRRRHLEILFEYLRRNLRPQSNTTTGEGGHIDRVLIAVLTEVPWDVQYIERYCSENPRFEILVRNTSKVKFARSMAALLERHANVRRRSRRVVYIKLDDDIVFIDRRTLSNMALAKVRDVCLFVSASVVNHPRLSHYHQLQGAIMEFRGDEGPWLLVGNATTRNYTDDPFGECSWKGAECGANVHESFLHRLTKEGDISRFDITFDFHRNGYQRWSINAFAFLADDIAIHNWNGPNTNDEVLISSDIPELAGRHCCVVEGTVLVHYSYFPQRGFLDNRTTILQRYRNLILPP
jgi:hypothetical protein